MSTSTLSIRCGAILASTALFAAMSPLVATANAQEDTADDGSATVLEVDDAEFRWGINIESGTKAPAPNTTNFLSAGDVSGNLSGNMSKLPEGEWKGQDGDVVIEKRDSKGNVTKATEEDTAKDRDGDTLKSDQYNGFEAVFTGGQGEVDRESGTATIEWDGTITVIFYSGYTYFTLSDPVLEVTRSSATMTGTLKSHRTDQNNMELWEEMEPKAVTIADLDRSDVDLGGELGFATTPEYFNVSYTPKISTLPEQATGDKYFGAFPTDFIDYVADAGSGPYWYSSGGAADRRKNPLPLSICWDSAECDELPVTDGGSGSGSSGLLSDVINDFVEGVLYDTSDIFQTRIREDLDSVINGDATWGDLGSSDLADSTPTGGAAGGVAPSGGGGTDGDAGGTGIAAGDAGDDGVVPANRPVNAGTVGYAVTTATSPTSGGGGGTGSGSPSSGGTAGNGPNSSPSPALNTVSDNSYPLAASTRAEGGDVYYADVSQKAADSPILQWQWWVGGALLAAAAGITYMAIRKKI